MEIKGLNMTDQLRMLRGVDPIKPPPTELSPKESGGKASFQDFLMGKVEEVNQAGLAADQGINAAIRGEDVNPHSTIIAVQKAEMSFQLLMSVTDKLISAYQQISRMPLG